MNLAQIPSSEWRSETETYDETYAWTTPAYAWTTPGVTINLFNLHTNNNSLSLSAMAQNNDYSQTFNNSAPINNGSFAFNSGAAGSGTIAAGSGTIAAAGGTVQRSHQTSNLNVNGNNGTPNPRAMGPNGCAWAMGLTNPALVEELIRNPQAVASWSSNPAGRAALMENAMVYGRIMSNPVLMVAFFTSTVPDQAGTNPSHFPPGSIPIQSHGFSRSRNGHVVNRDLWDPNARLPAVEPGSGSRRAPVRSRTGGYDRDRGPNAVPVEGPKPKKSKGRMLLPDWRSLQTQLIPTIKFIWSPLGDEIIRFNMEIPSDFDINSPESFLVQPKI